MGFFTSPRQDQGSDLYNQFLNELKGMNSNFSGINNISDLEKTFGVSSDLSSVYRPQRANLATSAANQRRSIASRLGTDATPETSFLPVEQGLAEGESNLAGQEASNTIGQQNILAGFLQNIFSQKDQFGFRKAGLQQQGIGDYLNTLSPSSGFNDVLSGLGLAGNVAGALGWKPFK